MIRAGGRAAEGTALLMRKARASRVRIPPRPPLWSSFLTKAVQEVLELCGEIRRKEAES